MEFLGRYDNKEIKFDNSFSSAVKDGKEYGIIDAFTNDRGKSDISGSEILYRQYKMALPSVPPLRILRRMGVFSDTGVAVNWYLRSVLNCKDGQTFFPHEKGFHALLGTENFSAAPYLIRDHGQEFRVSAIESIKLTQNGFEMFVTLSDA